MHDVISVQVRERFGHLQHLYDVLGMENDGANAKRN